jgi:hypothetical protein
MGKEDAKLAKLVCQFSSDLASVLIVLRSRYEITFTISVV